MTGVQAAALVITFGAVALLLITVFVLALRRKK